MNYKRTFKTAKYVLASFKKDSEFMDAVSTLQSLLTEVHKDSRNGSVKRLYERTTNHYYMYSVIEQEAVTVLLRDTLIKTKKNNPFPLIYIEFKRKNHIFISKQLTFPLISNYTDEFVTYPLEMWDQGKWILNQLTEIVQLLRGNPHAIKKEVSSQVVTENVEDVPWTDELLKFSEQGELILTSPSLKESFFSLLEALESYTQDVHNVPLVEDQHDIERMIKTEIQDFLLLYQKLDEKKRTLYHDRYVALVNAMTERVRGCLGKEENVDLELEKQFQILEERYLDPMKK